MASFDFFREVKQLPVLHFAAHQTQAAAVEQNSEEAKPTESGRTYNFLQPAIQVKCIEGVNPGAVPLIGSLQIRLLETRKLLIEIKCLKNLLN